MKYTCISAIKTSIGKTYMHGDNLTQEEYDTLIGNETLHFQKEDTNPFWERGVGIEITQKPALPPEPEPIPAKKEIDWSTLNIKE